MDALRYMCMGLPMDLRDCYISKQKLINTKETILDRIKPDTNIDDLLNMNEGGAFGLGAFRL